MVRNFVSDLPNSGARSSTTPENFVHHFESLGIYVNVRSQTACEQVLEHELDTECYVT